MDLLDVGFHSKITGVARVGESFEIGRATNRFKRIPTVDLVTKVKYDILSILKMGENEK